MRKSKRSKISSERFLIIVAFVGIVFPLVCLIVIFFLGLPTKNSAARSDLSQNTARQNLVSSASVEFVGPVTNPEARLHSSGRPIRLKIPTINVNAVVTAIGLTADGTMDVPKGPADAGWFKLGKLPGDNGSAVIDGHFGWGDGIPAVFDDLHKLQKGDKIYIENDKDEIISFVVRASKSFDPDANPASVFDSNDGKAHLNLITCEGAWDKDSKSYSKRLIVFADKENSVNE